MRCSSCSTAACGSWRPRKRGSSPSATWGRVRPSTTCQTLAGSLGSVLVRATAPTRLARVPGADVDTWADRSGPLRDALARMHRRELLCSLHPVLGTLDEPLLDQVERAAAWQELGRGEVLEPPEAIHLVVSGLVEVLDEDGVVVDEAGRGDTVGELRFFGGRDAREQPEPCAPAWSSGSARPSSRRCSRAGPGSCARSPAPSSSACMTPSAPPAARTSRWWPSYR